jgi:UDP-2,3-diacylglucosamine pyrophosphatase LpxH
MRLTPARRRYRSVFVSDIHLGTRACRADLAADFLHRIECEHLFLVGDIIDGWRLRRAWHWDRDHDEVVRRVIAMARNGTAVTYIPGNHDEMLRDWLGLELAGIRIAPEAEHETADGRRLLVLHGDEFDGAIRYGRIVSGLGDLGYDAAIAVNRLYNGARRRIGLPDWSLAQWLKRQVKGAATAIARFESALAQGARARGFDGVVCGHIHQPEMRDIHGVLYLNDGDWVENCTALVEHADGRFELLDWAREVAAREGRVLRGPAAAQLPA